MVSVLLPNFSDASVKVLQLAFQETKELGHDVTGTEHLLLGLLSQESCRPAKILKSMGVTVQKAQEEVLRIMHRGTTETPPDFQFTARARAAFELAQKSNFKNSENQIEPEAILSAMLTLPRCTAQKVLHALDIDAEYLLSRLASDEIIETGAVTIDELADLHRRVQSGDLSGEEAEPEEDWAKDPMIGYIVDRKYEIVSLIGHGGMGVVYKVRHLILDREFAIKVIHPYLATDARNRRRFQREAQAASLLTHPNLATVFDWDIMEDGRPYLVMYYIDGVKLQELVKGHQSVRLSTWVSIFNQICDGLAHAHDRGVLHRDLKPGNVILSKAESASHFVKIVDFGIAKILGPSPSEAKELTQEGEIFGSPYYMSPEQCLGRPLDIRCDIYGLGCVMYECLTGTHPFEGENAYETMTMHVNDPPRRFSEINPSGDVPPGVEAVVMRCLAKSPEERFQSMRSLKRELIVALASSK